MAPGARNRGGASRGRDTSVAAAPSRDHLITMRVHTRVPLFLVRVQGAESGPAAWWQRREMVVALVHAACAACDRFRERLASRDPVLRARGAGQVALELDGAGFRELAQRVVDTLGLEPGVAFAVVADRYGEALVALPVHGADADGVLGEIEAWLDHIQQQCPE